MRFVHGKVSLMNKFTSVANYNIDKAKKVFFKMKAHYKGEERVTLVDIFVGGTFPFTLAIFMHS